MAVQPKGRVERRLAAVLAADVVGYSRLMGANEVDTFERLKAHRSQLVDPKIREHNGRIVKTTGDGLLVEFASIVDAVQCAVEVQRGMADRNSGVLDEQRILLRVGINLGDVIIDGEDIHGDGVNIAARLEGLAEPGGICVSRTVRDQVRDKLSYTFQDMGEQSVKNIARPVHADALSAAAVAATPLIAVSVQVPTNPQSSFSVASTGAKPVPRLSIVVLPFDNLSNDPEQDYFVDAITDDLTTDLSRISESFVISRTTAFTYKGKSVDVKQIGQELGVRYVLEGSVRRLGEQVQVNVQLIDVEGGAHIWADRFDTDRANLANAQNEITARLAQTLHIELLWATRRQIEAEQPVSLDARDMIMRGWAGYFRPETEAQLQENQRYFERALELDPKSVDARIGIATILVEKATVGWSKSREDDLARAEQLLLEALERERSHARLHWAMGMLRRLQYRFIESKLEFEKAISIDRNFASAMLQLGFSLTILGQPEAALLCIEKAYQLNPRHQNLHFTYYGLGVCHLFLGHLDEAIEFFTKAHAASSRIYFFPLYLAATLGLKGNTEEARALLCEAQKLKPELRSLADLHRYHATFRSPPYAALAESTLDVGLRRAGLPDEALPDKPSIAVLPFQNMSGDPEQEYFADGMVEEIITALSRIRWLLVIARNSSFTYKGQAVDVKRVGRELGVRYVLEGSVRKGSSRVRITAQLIEAETGAHLWADRFDGTLEDVFDLQDQVATSVAGVIEPTLEVAETARSTARPTADLTAYDLYMRAVALFGSTRLADALRLVEQAVARDPNYAAALALAGGCYMRRLFDSMSENRATDRQKGWDLAKRALDNADDDPVILARAGAALAYFGEDIGAMIAVLDRALALNPNYAQGWFLAGMLRMWAGQPDSAIEYVETSLRLSPRTRIGAQTQVIGAAHLVSRRFEQALPKLLLAANEEPNQPNPRRFLAACYAHMGRLDEARRVIQYLKTITLDVVPDATYLRNIEQREVLLSGLRLAMGEAE